MITPARIIQKKRDGNNLSEEEIRGFISGVSQGEIADYQATAFLMAVYFQKMNLLETVALTRAMLESGVRYDLSEVQGFKIDKHSTGGIGDKVSLILAPLAAACGLKVPMMAGRGLGHTGGTLDKLEAISGFNVQISERNFIEILKTVGTAIIGQTESIVPADKKLYALRDVTATVECIPLIVASILSKKLAEGAEGLILDIKVGTGAFMKTKDEARKLAKTLVQVGKKLGLKVRAVLTQMDQPLGYAVGNALEVQECIEILNPLTEKVSKPKGDSGSGDLKELTIQLCAHMLELSGKAKNLVEGRKLAHAKLADGSAWKVFQQMVKSQGGSMDQILQPETLPTATRQVTWKAPSKGYLASMDAETIGHILTELGGGRKKASDRIDFSVGMAFHKKLGAKLQKGDPIVTVYAPDGLDLDSLEERFIQSLQMTSARKPVPKLIYETLS